jgi:hypothetical protein
VVERSAPWRRWWFWTAAGVIAAGGVLGLTAALGGFSRGGSCPPGYRCM